MRNRIPSIDQGQVEKLKADGLGATEIAKRLKIGRASVYRVFCALVSVGEHQLDQL